MRTRAKQAGLILPLALLALSSQVSAQSPVTREQAQRMQRDCATIDACIVAMRTGTSVNTSGTEGKFAVFGEAAVAPLMVILTSDPDPRMRSYAAMALARMPRIDSRYLPDLIAASRQGNPAAFMDTGPAWVAIPIGLVRDNPEALAYLFDIAEAAGDRLGGGPLQPAIPRSSEAAILAEAQRRLEGFRPDQSAEFLGFVSQLVSQGGWPRREGYTPPPWFEPALARIATDPAMNTDARDTAATLLRRFRHPIALTALLRDARQQFATLPEWDGRSRFVRMKDAEGRDQWERLSDGEFGSTIVEIGRFGPIGIEAAPLLRPFLSRPDLPGSRADAALALGRIGDRSAIPLLITAAANPDDWLLAYNAAEALGRLRAEDAKETLRRIAAGHWSRAVRNNAERALHMIDGGDFSRPGVAGSGERIAPDSQGYLYMGEARYEGDDAGDQLACPSLGSSRRLTQSPLGRLRFPNEDIREIEASPASARDLTGLPGWIRPDLPRGRVTAIEPLRHGLLVGADAGEFIGGLAYVDDGARGVTMVVPDNVSMMFRHGGKLYVLTGLSHMVSSRGEIWEIDEGGRPPSAVRRIPLPTEVRTVFATARRDLAFVTGEGTVLLGEDGVLRRGDDEATCVRP